MENDVLKNKIAPWQEKGRWYHGIWDCASNALIREKSDEFLQKLQMSILTGSAPGLYITDHAPNDTNILCRIISVKTKYVGLTAATNTFYYVGTVRLYANNTMAICIGPSSSTGTIEFWAFIEEV